MEITEPLEEQDRETLDGINRIAGLEKAQKALTRNAFEFTCILTLC